MIEIAEFCEINSRLNRCVEARRKSEDVVAGEYPPRLVKRADDVMAVEDGTTEMGRDVQSHVPSE